MKPKAHFSVIKWEENICTLNLNPNTVEHQSTMKYEFIKTGHICRDVTTQLMS